MIGAALSHLDLNVHNQSIETEARAKRRILHVSNVFDGGISRAVTKIAELTPGAEHHLIAGGREVRKYASLFRTVEQLPPSHFHAVTAIKRSVNVIRPDVVHAHSSWAGMYCRLLPTRTRVVYQPHCYVTSDPGRSPFERAIFQAAENLLSLRRQTVVTLSAHEHSQAEGLIGSRLGAQQLVRIPNVPSLIVGPDSAAKFETQTENATVATIGRVCEQKDPQYFTRVVGHLRREGYRGNIVWIGGGDETLTRMLQECGVTVTGWLEKMQMRDLLSHINLYIHTARYEGFPLSVLDAAAFKLPIIARNIPCFVETGVLTLDQPEEIARAACRTLTNQADWYRLQKTSIELLDRMSEPKQREALTELYKMDVSMDGAR